MKIDQLPSLDGQVWYDIQKDYMIVYYRVAKKSWMFWKKQSYYAFKSIVVQLKEPADTCKLTTTQGTYEWNGKEWNKVLVKCKYCGRELVLGSICDMCASLEDAKARWMQK